jgi:hypothetical protein
MILQRSPAAASSRMLLQPLSISLLWRQVGYMAFGEATHDIITFNLPPGWCASCAPLHASPRPQRRTRTLGGRSHHTRCETVMTQTLLAAQVHAGGEGGAVHRPVPHLPADDDPGYASTAGTLCCHYRAGHDGRLEQAPLQALMHGQSVHSVCISLVQTIIFLYCLPCSV